MANTAPPMTVLEVKKIFQPGLHFVGGTRGLILNVGQRGSRSWILRFTASNGKRRDMGLGSYPDVGLKEAREEGDSILQKIRGGIDPVVERRANTSPTAGVSGTPTFEHCANQYIEDHRAGWANRKHEAQWRSTLSTYAFQVIGGLPVDAVTSKHVIEILRPIWASKTETANRVRGRIESVLTSAAAQGYRQGANPASWKGNLEAVFPSAKKVSPVRHFEAVSIADAPRVFASVQSTDGVGARCLELTILAACRSGEARLAAWSEIDLGSAIWTIPAARMKAKRDHRVALSPAAVAVLRAQPRYEDTDLVFSSPIRGKTRNPVSDMTLTAVMRRLKLTATVHGWRSTFKDWAAEKTDYPNELSEMALAHTIGSAVEAAYRRGDMFEKRRRIMADWAAFLARRG